MPVLNTTFAPKGVDQSLLLPVALRRTAIKPVAGQCSCGERRPLSVVLGVRSKLRPQFEGRWHCRRGCLHDTVKTAVTREFRGGVAGESRMRHRVPLGLILQTRGVITQRELKDALVMQERTGERLGDVLVRHFRVQEGKIAAALAAQWNAPLWHMEKMPDHRLLRIAPLQILQSAGMVPVRIDSNCIHLASTQGIDSTLAFALERMHRTDVECGIASNSVVEKLWLSAEAENARSVEEVLCQDMAEISRRLARTIEQLQPIESRAVRVGRRMWLRAWLEPAALNRGPLHQEDVVDYLFTLPASRPSFASAGVAAA